MSEFKGTKVKWVYTASQFKDYVKVNCDNYIGKQEPILYTVNAENNDDVWNEIRANALLISKAPEMLEVLNEITSSFTNEELNQCLPSFAYKINKAKQLIKQATEI